MQALIYTMQLLCTGTGLDINTVSLHWDPCPSFLLEMRILHTKVIQ